MHLAHIALMVRDYDEAIAFFTAKLDFRLLEDTPLTDDKRWVIVSPQGAGACSLLLARAANEKQKLAIGNQTGGRVFLFLHRRLLAGLQQIHRTWSTVCSATG
jgi:catechol 2,3-dioxygenase-like lactoylglutathione lyase family enzyme